MTNDSGIDALVASVASTASIDYEGCTPCQLAAQEAAARAAASDPRWAGIIGFEGVLTGDGRYIAPDALRWETLPIPIRAVFSDVGAHDGAQVVGQITHIERKPIKGVENAWALWGEGVFDLGSEAGREAVRLVGRELSNGISMDLDDVTFEVRVANTLEAPVQENATEVEVDDLATIPGQAMKVLTRVSPTDEITVTTDGRIRAATLVAVAAFSQARVFLADETDEEDQAGEVQPIPEEEAEQDEEGTEEFDNLVVVGLLAPNDHPAPDEVGQHLTLAFAEKLSDEDLATTVEAVTKLVSGGKQIPAQVAETGPLGDAQVLFLNSENEPLQELRAGVVAIAPVEAAMAKVHQYPEWTPHVSVAYGEGDEPPESAEFGSDTELKIVGVGVWNGNDHTDIYYAPGEKAVVRHSVAEPQPAEEEPIAAAATPTQADASDQVVESLYETGEMDNEEFNWVEDVGGLPLYIRRIADALIRRGHAESHAIATAVNTVKRWARGGSVRANGGPNVRPDTAAKAAAALASWYAKRAAARASASEKTVFTIGNVKLSEQDVEALAQVIERAKVKVRAETDELPRHDPIEDARDIDVIPVAEEEEVVVVEATDDELSAAVEALRERAFRDFTPKQREKAADSGDAMDDGSFPIENATDLENAIQAVGRAKDYDAAKRHIKRRARELDLEDKLPADWSVDVVMVN